MHRVTVRMMMMCIALNVQRKQTVWMLKHSDSANFLITAVKLMLAFARITVLKYGWIRLYEREYFQSLIAEWQ